MKKFKVGDDVKFIRDFGDVFNDGIRYTICKDTIGQIIKVRTSLWGEKLFTIKAYGGNGIIYIPNVCESFIELIFIESYRIYPIKHIINDRTTIVILSDGRKGVAKCHPDDEFDEYEGLRIATAKAYGKDPFPKEEVKDEKKEPEYKFNVGDMVVVIDTGCRFSAYKEKFKEIAPKGKWAKNQNGFTLTEQNGEVVKIIGRGKHAWDGNIYAIQDFDGNGYLIGEKGIAKVEVNI